MKTLGMLTAVAFSLVGFVWGIRHADEPRGLYVALFPAYCCSVSVENGSSDSDQVQPFSIIAARHSSARFENIDWPGRSLTIAGLSSKRDDQHEWPRSGRDI